MSRQIIEWEMQVPTPNRREHHFTRSKRVAAQRFTTRRILESMGKRPRLPIVVTLVRISTRLADTDRAALSLDTVRDEVARWSHGIPEWTVGADGKPRVPRAPDSPYDRGIRFLYGQHRSKTKGTQGVRVIIEEVRHGEAKEEQRAG